MLTLREVFWPHLWIHSHKSPQIPSISCHSYVMLQSCPFQIPLYFITLLWWHHSASFIFHPCPGSNRFLWHNPEFHETGLQQISLNSSWKHFHHFSALVFLNWNCIIIVLPLMTILMRCEVTACYFLTLTWQFWVNHDCRWISQLFSYPQVTAVCVCGWGGTFPGSWD